MNFLFDENFPKAAGQLLLRLGHHVIDIRGTDTQGADDQQLFDIAQEHKAILLTTDLDFYHTIPWQRPTHHGVIVIALKQPNRSAIMSRLRWAIAHELTADITDSVVLIRDNTYRIRRSRTNSSR